MKSLWNQFRMDRAAVAISLICILALYRILPHPDNFTPVGSLALFGGYIWGRSSRWAYVIPLVALFISDLILGLHTTMFFVYAAVVMGVLVGSLLQKRISVLLIGATSLVNSIVFFVVSNFGVWAAQNMYPKTASGLGECFIAALPFFRQTLTSDLIFTLAVFGIFSILFQREKKSTSEASSLKTAP